MRSLACRPAMRQVIRSEEIRLARVIENVVTGVDTRVKMRIDKSRRHEAAIGVDLLVNRLIVVLTDELEAIAVVYDDAVFDDFMLNAVEADDIAPLDQCFHDETFPLRMKFTRRRTNKTR